MGRAAMCVGINDYENVEALTGCESDAREIHKRLLTHDNGAPNFASELHLSSKARLTRIELKGIVSRIFTMQDLDAALFYFAGHGVMTESGPFLVSQDGEIGDEGIPMAEVIAKANASNARERIIILDCCNSGAIDSFFTSTSAIPLKKGVSILASSRGTEQSEEQGGRGLFTSKVCDALDGGAADVLGSVTVASIYAYVDQVFTLFEQRPQFMANVSKLVSLREAGASVSPEKLRKLIEYFPKPAHVFKLSPSYEPTAEPHDEDKEAVFSDLQRFRGARLLEPNGTEHMYYAAMESRSCTLTPLGRSFWERANRRKIP